MSDWQPIETVPTDGTRVLLTPAVWEPERVVSGKFKLGLWWIESPSIHGALRTFMPPVESEHWPFTHWMPLPAPPKVQP